MLDAKGRPVKPAGGWINCIKCDEMFLSWDLCNNRRCRPCLLWASEGQVEEGVEDFMGSYVDRPADKRRKKKK